MRLAGKEHFIFGNNLELDDRSTRCCYGDYSARLQQGHCEIKISAEPKFMPKFTWDREWSKNFKGDHKKKLFQKFENR